MKRPTIPGRVIALALTVVPAGACKDAAPGPALGAAEVAAEVAVRTAGFDLDPDGYTVSVDSGPAQPIAINGTITLRALVAGNHVIVLGGVAANCAVTGDSRRTMRVSANATALVQFVITCALLQLAVVSSRDRNDEIYRINSDGSGLVRLTNNPAIDADPAWSPHGSKIAFWSNRDDRNGEIYVMDADGSGVVRLTDNSARDAAPSWSPDGSRIAFQSDRSGTWEIYVMNADGSSATRLTRLGGMLPSWSPTNKIAFASTPDGNNEIYVMNDDGSGVVRLTNDPSADIAPAWSPDGTQIAFLSDRDGDVTLYTMNTDGSNPTRLLAGQWYGLGDWSWSPNGSKVAFATEDCSWEGCYSYIVTVEIANATSRFGLGSCGVCFSPAWRPRVP